MAKLTIEVPGETTIDELNKALCSISAELISMEEEEHKDWLPNLGRCPALFRKVEAQLRNGSSIVEQAGTMMWHLDGRGDDIIKYRYLD